MQSRFSPDIRREVLPEPLVVLGEIGVLGDPQLDHVGLLVEAEQAEPAGGHQRQGEEDGALGVSGDPYSMPVFVRGKGL